MLSPETSLFPAPRVTRATLLNATISDCAVALGLAPKFHHSVTVISPFQKNLPESLLHLFNTDNYFYKIINCPADELIDHQFLDLFVNRGELFCLSINTCSDIDNCIGITENGNLIIHVIDKLYEELCLDGVKSSKNFYEICINLKDSNLKSMKYHEKVKRCLKKMGSFNFIMKWRPHSDDVCPSSVAKYFYERNVKVKAKETEVTLLEKNVTRVPRLRDNELEELVEWVGLVALDGDLNPKEPYVSLYATPDDEESLLGSEASVLIATGFFTHEDVENIYSELIKHNSDGNSTEWTAMSCHSFTDAPQKHCKSMQFKTNDTTLTIFTSNANNIIHKTVVFK